MIKSIFSSRFLLSISIILTNAAVYAGSISFENFNHELKEIKDQIETQKKHIKINSINYDDNNSYIKFLLESSDFIKTIQNFADIENSKPDTFQEMKSTDFFYYYSKKKLEQSQLLYSVLNSINQNNRNFTAFNGFPHNLKQIQEKMNGQEHDLQVPVFGLYLKILYPQFIEELNQKNEISLYFDILLSTSIIKSLLLEKGNYFYEGNSFEKILEEKNKILNELEFSVSVDSEEIFNKKSYKNLIDMGINEDTIFQEITNHIINKVIDQKKFVVIPASTVFKEYESEKILSIQNDDDEGYTPEPQNINSPTEKELEDIKRSVKIIKELKNKTKLEKIKLEKKLEEETNTVAILGKKLEEETNIRAELGKKLEEETNIRAELEKKLEEEINIRAELEKKLEEETNIRAELEKKITKQQDLNKKIINILQAAITGEFSENLFS